MDLRWREAARELRAQFAAYPPPEDDPGLPEEFLIPSWADPRGDEVVVLADAAHRYAGNRVGLCELGVLLLVRSTRPPHRGQWTVRAERSLVDVFPEGVSSVDGWLERAGLREFSTRTQRELVVTIRDALRRYPPADVVIPLRELSAAASA